MTEYINKAEVVKELERIIKEQCPTNSYEGRNNLLLCKQFLYFINTLEVTDVDTVKCDWYNQGYIKGRKQSNIPARELGLPSELDIFEAKEVDLDKEIKDYIDQQPIVGTYNKTKYQLIPPAEKIARYFYKLGRVNARKNK